MRIEATFTHEEALDIIRLSFEMTAQLFASKGLRMAENQSLKLTGIPQLLGQWTQIENPLDLTLTIIQTIPDEN